MIISCQKQPFSCFFDDIICVLCQMTKLSVTPSSLLLLSDVYVLWQFTLYTSCWCCCSISNWCLKSQITTKRWCCSVSMCSMNYLLFVCRLQLYFKSNCVCSDTMARGKSVFVCGAIENCTKLCALNFKMWKRENGIREVFIKVLHTQCISRKRL